MTWNRNTSELERLAVQILKKKKEPLSLQEIVDEISKVTPECFTGTTPRNSLYSIIYRREKRREAVGGNLQFLQTKCRGEVLFSLNPKYQE